MDVCGKKYGTNPGIYLIFMNLSGTVFCGDIYPPVICCSDLEAMAHIEFDDSRSLMMQNVAI